VDMVGARRVLTFLGPANRSCTCCARATVNSGWFLRTPKSSKNSVLRVWHCAITGQIHSRCLEKQVLLTASPITTGICGKR